MNRLLLLFVAHPGTVVTRRQIADTLWENHNTVDVEMGINSAVRRLRKYLGGDEQGAAIETLVGVGYRLLAEVVIVEGPEEPAAEKPVSGLAEPAVTDTVPQARRRLEWRWAAAASVVAVALAAGAWSLIPVRRNAPAPANVAPLFNQLHPVTFDEPEDGLSAQALSPSGNSIIYAERSWLTLRNLITSQDKRLDVPKGFHIDSLSWYPDESAVLASGSFERGTDGVPAASGNQVWKFVLSEATPHFLLNDAAMATVSPDGQTVAFLRAQNSEVWLAGPGGESGHALVSAPAGDIFLALLWSPRGDRVVVDRAQGGLRHLPGADTEPAAESPTHNSDGVYETYDAKTGALRSQRVGMRFTSAVLREEGTLLYLPANAEELRAMGLARTDPNTGAVLHQTWVPWNKESWQVHPFSVATLSGSREGRMLSSILSRPAINVYTAELSTRKEHGPPELRNITRLSFRTGTTYPTGWSPDSAAVVFDDGIAGPVSVTLQRLDGTPQQHIVRSTATTTLFTHGQFSPDGKWILFADVENGITIGIKRISPRGGTPESLHMTGTVEEFHCSGSPAGRCVLRELEGKDAMVYYELDPSTGIGRELARTPWEPNVLGDWNISPDGRTVAMAHHDPNHPVVELVPLSVDGDPHRTPEAGTEISLPGFGTVLSAHWSADGQAMFVETASGPQYNLVWLGLDGRAGLLRQSNDLIWAVPSPDGKKIAFPDTSPLNRNIWIANIDWAAAATKH